MKQSLEWIGVLSGDVGLSSTNGFYAQAIKFFESLHTGKASKSHAWSAIGNDLIIEALYHITINKLDKYDNLAFTNLSIYRLPLSFEERKSFAEGMMLKAGEGYGWLQLPLFALDGFATGISRLFGGKTPVFWFTQKAGIFSIPVCSQLVCYGLIKFTNYRFKDLLGGEVGWRDCSPDYLEDLLKLPHNRAIAIYERKPK